MYTETMAKHRTQLLLEREQHDAISRLAASQDRSISEIVREFVGAGLAAAEQDRRRRLEALEALAEIRRRVEARAGVLREDPIAAAREERSRQLESVVGLGARE